MGVRSRLEQLLNEAPGDARVVEFEEEWKTWGALQTTARALEAVLARNGVRHGARVGLVLENRPEHVAVLLTLLASGRCTVAFSPLQPAERLAADIERTDVPVVVGSPDVLVQEGVRKAVESSGLSVELNRAGELSTTGGCVPGEIPANPGTAIEMLTSGTTGPPKRVELRDEQLDYALDSSVSAPRTDSLLRSSVSLVTTPLVHIGGLWGAVSALYAGRGIVLMQRFQLEPWVRAVERHRLRAAGLVPAAMRTVLDADVPREKLSSLEVVTCGTTFCPAELAEVFSQRYGIRVLMTYGATEFAGAIAAWTLPMHKKWWPAKAGSTGRAMPGVALRVTNTDGEVLPANEVGHLEARTKQALQGDHTWVRTSDLASLDEDGFLWIKGRADDAIIRGGFKVQPDQVVKALERHPSVREASVAPLPDERLGHVPVAGVEVMPDSAKPEVGELLALCRDVLTPYEVPAHLVVLDELPRTPSSKVSRVELLELVRGSMASDQRV